MSLAAAELHLCVHSEDCSGTEVDALMQDEGLREALEGAERRLRALDVEDLDAEREQLALTEHILGKLRAGPDSACAAEPAQAPTDLPTAAPDQAPQAQRSAERLEQPVQKPVAMLGPP